MGPSTIVFGCLGSLRIAALVLDCGAIARGSAGRRRFSRHGRRRRRRRRRVLPGRRRSWLSGRLRQRREWDTTACTFRLRHTTFVSRAVSNSFGGDSSIDLLLGISVLWRAVAVRRAHWGSSRGRYGSTRRICRCVCDSWIGRWHGRNLSRCGLARCPSGCLLYRVCGNCHRQSRHRGDRNKVGCGFRHYRRLGEPVNSKRISAGCQRLWLIGRGCGRRRRWVGRRALGAVRIRDTFKVPKIGQWSSIRDKVMLARMHTRCCPRPRFESSHIRRRTHMVGPRGSYDRFVQHLCRRSCLHTVRI